jgi:hypothetical protein
LESHKCIPREQLRGGRRGDGHLSVPKPHPLRLNRVLTATTPRSRQPWPADLPLVAVMTDEDGAETEGLDMGVVLYSCSFAVIFLMILSQVTDGYDG